MYKIENTKIIDGELYYKIIISDIDAPLGIFQKTILSKEFSYE